LTAADIEEEPEPEDYMHLLQGTLPRLLLHARTIYYSHGFLQKDVLQCNDCLQDEIKSKSYIKNRDRSAYALTPATWHNEAYDSICQSIKELRFHSFIVNYYDAVKAAYLKKTPKLDYQYNPMTIRDYLLGLDIKDVNKIDRNLETLWPLTFRIVNNEDRIKVVNKDADNLLIS
jgi:hypothetical protein